MAVAHAISSGSVILWRGRVDSHRECPPAFPFPHPPIGLQGQSLSSSQCAIRTQIRSEFVDLSIPMRLPLTRAQIMKCGRMRIVPVHGGAEF